MRPIDIFYQAAQTYHSKIAAIEFDCDLNQKQISYGDLLLNAQALASALQHITRTDQPKIALLTENSIKMLTATLAIYACQGVLIPLTTGYPKHELLKQIHAVQPDAIIADTHFSNITKACQIKVFFTQSSHHVAQPSINQLIEKFKQHQPFKSNFCPEQTAAIKFTGGSSGRPKAVVQPARALTAVAICSQKSFELNETDRFLLATPMTHGAGTFVLPVLGAGGCLMITKNVKADYLLHLMERKKITGFWLPPTLLYRLIDKQKVLNHNLSALKNLIYGGAGLTPSRLKQAAKVFGHALGVCYGQTEAPMILTAANSKDAEMVLKGSVGKAAFLSKVAIVNQNGKRLKQGQIGEIIGRGELLMKGYLNNPTATKQVIKNGWLHTGDLGYLDENGYLYIKGRLKEIIISGGFNIYPAEIEAVLSSYTGVLECCVFGVPDEEWGERVEAAVELDHHLEIKPKEIKLFLRKKLGAVRTPKKIHHFKSLPRTSLGKINKTEILHQLQYDTDALQ